MHSIPQVGSLCATESHDEKFSCSTPSRVTLIALGAISIVLGSVFFSGVFGAALTTIPGSTCFSAGLLFIAIGCCSSRCHKEEAHDLSQMTVEELYSLASAHINDRNYDQVLSCYESAGEKGSAAAYLYAADYCELLRKPHLAQEYLKKAIAHEGNLEAFCRLALHALSQKKYADGLIWILKVHEMRPEFEVLIEKLQMNVEESEEANFEAEITPFRVSLKRVIAAEIENRKI